MPVKLSNPEQSRMDRIQQLRAEHQRRHVERSGMYIPEEKQENDYESDIRQVCIMLYIMLSLYISRCILILILFLARRQKSKCNKSTW